MYNGMYKDNSEAGTLRRVKTMLNTRDAKLRRSAWYTLAVSLAACESQAVAQALINASEACGIDDSTCCAYLAWAM